MNISDVRIRLNKRPDGPVKAFASFCIDDAFVVHDLRVLESANGLFVAMPSRKRSSDGEFVDIAHPANSDVRAEIQTAILDAYQKEIAAEADNAAQPDDEPWNQ